MLARGNIRGYEDEQMGCCFLNGAREVKGR